MPVRIPAPRAARWVAALMVTLGFLAIGQALGAADLPVEATRNRMLQNEFKVNTVSSADWQMGPLARRAFELNRREVAALREELKPWAKDRRGRLLTDGRHTEHGIRPNTQAMIGLAVVALRSDSERERAETLADLKAMLWFVAATHSAGPLTANDDQKWRNQWQSALWAYQAGSAAWLVWDQLEPDLQWLLANLTAAEADRFVGQPPPFQIKNDTKAEENAWNSSVVALAANLLSKHPRQAVWRDTAVRWQLSSFLTQEDVVSDRVVDGKKLADWQLGANLHPDYTLENHQRVHPSYMTTFTINLGQHLLYRWGGQPSPEALDFNAAKIYAHAKFLSHPDDRLHFPNGQDWELHRLTLSLHALMNVLGKDPEAAWLERVSFETLEKMQARSASGRTLLPQEYFFPSLPSSYVDSYAKTFLLHALYGEGRDPVGESEFQQRYTGVRHFEHGKFLAQRTPGGFTSFSWGNRVMGQAIPFAKDLLGSPNELGFVGTVEAAVEGGPAARRGSAAQPAIEEVRVQYSNRWFSVVARLSRARGAIEQQTAFISLPEGCAVYAERITARKALEVERLETGAIGVLNEPEWVYQDGPRRLRWEGGEAAVDGLRPTPSLAIQSPWVNLDDRWGFIGLGATAWSYDANDKPSRGRREQRLCFAPPAQKKFSAGQVIAQRTLVVKLKETASGTAAIAADLKKTFRERPDFVSITVNGWKVACEFKPDLPTATIESMVKHESK